MFDNNHSGFKSENNNTAVANPKGRFPSNVILTYDNINEQEVCGGFPKSNKVNGSITNPNLKNSLGNNGIYNKYLDKHPLWEAYNDSGSVARYFMNCKFTNKDGDIEVKNNKMEDEKIFRIINGDSLVELEKLGEATIDSIVTDPPYELNFMNKGWDNAGVSFRWETWEKCLRVLKPRRIFTCFWWKSYIS